MESHTGLKYDVVDAETEPVFVRNAFFRLAAAAALGPPIDGLAGCSDMLMSF